MSDKVIVSKKDLNDLPYVEQEHSGDKYVLLEDVKHWLEDATPVSGEVAGYVEEEDLRDMVTKRQSANLWHKKYKESYIPLYTTPQPAILEGYVPVPIVPTEAMLKAGKKYQHENYVSDEYNLLKLYHGIYYAMITEAIKGE